MKKIKIKTSVIVILAMLCTMSTSVFGQELCTSCECEEESNTEFSVDIGEEGGQMGFSEGEILGAEVEEAVGESVGATVDIATDALAAIGITDLVSGVTGTVGALGFLAFEVLSIFEGEHISQIHQDHNVAKIMHGGDFEFPMVPSMHIPVEDLNAETDRFSGMFYLKKHMESQDVRTYLEENKADRHVDKAYNISKFNTHTSYAFSTFKDTITGPNGIKDNVITYKYNIPDFTFYTENNKLYYRYNASWKHKLDYTWDRSYHTTDTDSDDYYTVSHNYKMDTGHSKLIEGEVRIQLATVEPDGKYNTRENETDKVHVEDLGDRLAVRIKDISFLPRASYYLIFSIEKPFHFIGNTLGQDYVGTSRVFPENYDPARSDNRFTLTKTFGPNSDTPGKVTVSHGPALIEADSNFYPDTDGIDAIHPTPGGISPNTYTDDSLFFIKLLDYQARDTKESITKKESQGQEASINVFPEIYTTSQMQFTTGSVNAPDPGKSNLHFDVPYTVGPKKDIDFIELEVLNHPHTLIVDFKGDVNSSNANTIYAYVNSETSTNDTLVFKGVNVKYKETSYEEQHLYDNNIVTFNNEGEDAGFMLLNVPIVGGDFVDITTFYTDNSFSRKLVKMNAVTNNIVKRDYYHIKESHGVYSPNNHFLKANEEGVKISSQSTSSSNSKPEWLVEYQIDGLYAIMDKNSKKALGIVSGQIGVYNWNPDNEALYWQIEFGKKDTQGNYPIKLINSSQQAYLATSGHNVQQGETDLVFNFSNGNTFYLERSSDAGPVYVDKKVWLVNRYNNRVLGGNKGNIAKLEIADDNPTTNQNLDIIYSGCLTYAIQATNTKEFLYNNKRIGLRWDAKKASVFSLNKVKENSNFFTLTSEGLPLFNGRSSSNNISLDTNESPDMTDYRYHFRLSEKGGDINLLAHFKLDDGPTDSSGNEYHGEHYYDGHFAYFNPSYVDDSERGMVAHYDKEDHQIKVAYSFDPDAYNGDLTAEIWMKTNIPQYERYLFDFSTFSLRLVHTQGIELATNSRFSYGDGTYGNGINYNAVYNTGVIDNKWHHIAVVIDTQDNGSVNFSVYLDGSRIIHKEGNPKLSLDINEYAKALYIGRRDSYENNAFKGYLDDMKVWSKALSPQEIETNYVGSDLLAHYKFEDNAEDASGYKRHGSNNGVTYINDGERGKVAKFDGVDDYIDTNFDFHPSDYGGELTASVWMRTDNWGDAYARLLDADSWSMTRDNIGEGIRFYTYHNNTDGLYYYIKPNLSLTGKNWHHVALVMKPNGTGGTLKELYVDGKKVSYGSANLPLRKNRVNMLIGKWSVDDTKNFEGFMDDVKIWKKAFTAAEIETEFNSTKKYEPLIAHYTFNGDFNDQSTYQRHGTAHNGVALVDDLKRGEVAKFDGVDDYIDTNFDFHPSDYGGELTASVWMRTDNWGDAYARLLDADSWSMTRANTDNGIRFYTYHNNTDGLYYWLEYNPISPSLSLANDDWQHITLVMKPKSDGTTLKELYINGSIVGENTVNLPFRKRGIKTLIGKWSQDHSKNYNGYIDEIKIWKKALGRTEVYNEYENTRSKIENLALNKAATQSNDHSSGLYGASRAVDGVITGISPDFKHTLHNISEPWWQVDLGKLANIKEIRVYNRTDCCSERLINFHLFVSDVPFTSNTVSDVQGQLGVTDYHFSGQASNLTKQLVNKTGRYIRIQLEGTGTLSLAEVQVFGSFVSVSSKSSAKSRSIEVVNEAEDIPLTDLIIHPNASDGHFNIDFGITKVTDVTYNIYNLSGQRLLSERKVFNKAGNHRWKVDASQLSDGIYILEITSDLWKESKRLVIKK